MPAPGEVATTIEHTGARASAHNAWETFAVSANGRTVAWVDADAGEISIGDVKAGERAGALPGVAGALALSADGTRLAASESDAAAVWDLGGELVLRAEGEAPGLIALSADGGRVAFGSGAQVKVLDSLTARTRRASSVPPGSPRWPSAPTAPVWLVAATPARSCCATSSSVRWGRNLSCHPAGRRRRTPRRCSRKRARFSRAARTGRCAAWPSAATVRCWPPAATTPRSPYGTSRPASPSATGSSGHPGWRVSDGGKHWCTRSVAFRDDGAVVATSTWVFVHAKAAGRKQPGDTALLLWDMDLDLVARARPPRGQPRAIARGMDRARGPGRPSRPAGSQRWFTRCDCALRQSSVSW